MNDKQTTLLGPGPLIPFFGGGPVVKMLPSGKLIKVHQSGHVEPYYPGEDDDNPPEPVPVYSKEQVDSLLHNVAYTTSAYVQNANAAVEQAQQQVAAISSAAGDAIAIEMEEKQAAQQQLAQMSMAAGEAIAIEQAEKHEAQQQLSQMALAAGEAIAIEQGEKQIAQMQVSALEQHAINLSEQNFVKDQALQQLETVLSEKEMQLAALYEGAVKTIEAQNVKLRETQAILGAHSDELHKTKSEAEQLKGLLGAQSDALQKAQSESGKSAAALKAQIAQLEEENQNFKQLSGQLQMTHEENAAIIKAHEAEKAELEKAINALKDELSKVVDAPMLLDAPPQLAIAAPPIAEPAPANAPPPPTTPTLLEPTPVVATPAIAAPVATPVVTPAVVEPVKPTAKPLPQLPQVSMLEVNKLKEEIAKLKEAISKHQTSKPTAKPTAAKTTTAAKPAQKKTELTKAKQIAKEWWDKHPRAKSQDMALSNKNVVTKAADYVPGKTDFKGVDTPKR